MRTPDTEVAPISPGAEILPGHVAVELLARGRRLDTYDAWDETRSCRVVVKILRPERRREPALVASVVREGSILASMAHPHLVRGFEVVNDPPALVLESLGGATLDALIEDSRLSATDTAHLGIQLASALGYLHHRNWLHLDIKPENIVVDCGRAVLIDLSHASRPGSGDPGAGTPAYLAPEQVTGTGLCPATDVWLLGTSMWEALTGELPHSRESCAGRLPRRGSRRSRAARLPSDVPAVLAAAITATRSPVPGDRPTMRELSAACAEVAGDPRTVSDQ